MGYGFQRLGQGHTAGGCAIREQRGEVEPQQLWHREPLLRAVGWDLYPIPPLPRNRCENGTDPTSSTPAGRAAGPREVSRRSVFPPISLVLLRDSPDGHARAARVSLCDISICRSWAVVACPWRLPHRTSAGEKGHEEAMGMVSGAVDRVCGRDLRQPVEQQSRQPGVSETGAV